jgi:carboxynorspermidine decarboxylase
MLDPQRVPSPSFVLELAAFHRNLAIIGEVAEQAGVTIILALKGFAMFRVFPEVRQVVPGVTASSLNEALLGAREFGGAVHACAPVYLENEFDEIARVSQHITFNSVAQYERFRARCPNASCGLRINPEYSEVKTDLYNPCVAGSRLGVRAEQLSSGLPDGIEGLHSHNLCECDSYALAQTLANIERLFGHLLPTLKWLNLGGGHLMTRDGYDRQHLIRILREFRQRYPHIEVILEPGAAFAWRTGVLVATVLDIVENCGIRTAILDCSFAAHMPDCLEMPYTPEARGALAADAETGWRCRLGGCSCLAGDYVGDFVFPAPLCAGDRVVFEDMMHYTMVKTNMFNGINLPTIGIWHPDDTFELVRNFDYEDYRNRLS